MQCVQDIIVICNEGKNVSLTCNRIDGYITKINEAQVHEIFVAIYHQLQLIIFDKNACGNQLTNETLKYITSSLKHPFTHITLWGIPFTSRCLQVVSEIITLCKNTLECFKFDFEITNVSDDDTEAINIFNTIMDKLSKLPKLICLDYGVFPIECNDFYKYFNYNNGNVSFAHLTEFDFDLSDQYAISSAILKNNLFTWIKYHQNIKKIRINSDCTHDTAYSDSPTTYKDRNDIKSLIMNFINGIIENTTVHPQIRQLYIHDFNHGIIVYKDMLKRLFKCKLMGLQDLSLIFNDMRDVCVDEIIQTMIDSNYIHQSITNIRFRWKNEYRLRQLLCEKFHNGSLSIWDSLWVLYGPDFLCTNDAKDNEKYLNVKFGVCSRRRAAANSNSFADMIQEWKSLHHANKSLKSLTSFIKKCRNLKSVNINYFDGVNIDHFEKFILVVQDGCIETLIINSIQCNINIIDNLSSLFTLRKHRFFRRFEIVFSDIDNDSLCALKCDGCYKCLQNMVDGIVNNQVLFAQHIESVSNTLVNIGFCLNIVKIIIGYTSFDEILDVKLFGLEKLMNKNCKQYFIAQYMKMNRNSDNNIKRDIEFNSFIDDRWNVKDDRIRIIAKNKHSQKNGDDNKSEQIWEIAERIMNSYFNN